MNLVCLPEEVERLASLREQETLDYFKSIKKKYKSAVIDKAVHLLYAEIAPKIDCTACANCCKKQSPVFTEEELKPILNYSVIGEYKNLNELLEHDEINHHYILRKKPCFLLKNNLCDVYTIRPASCSEYPHLNRPFFIYRNKSNMSNYKICPIVYNVIEALKNSLS